MMTNKICKLLTKAGLCFTLFNANPDPWSSSVGFFISLNIMKDPARIMHIIHKMTKNPLEEKQFAF